MKVGALPVRVLAAGLSLGFLFAGCGGEERSREELDALTPEGARELLSRTISKPWQGEEFTPGLVAGTWHDVMAQDPKSFNILVAEQDSATAGVTSRMLTYLAEYDPLKREWRPHAASFDIRVDEAADRLDLIYTLRDDLYWTWYGQERRVKVTSDDIVFWYNEIRGDSACASSGY
ncbi:MAG: ABC transporter substrate-binding protein, partial [Spirochaetaceae bacterium]|nr:ABC transporter substrate-binding protein [Spirochaetaceae bacterium]